MLRSRNHPGGQCWQGWWGRAGLINSPSLHPKLTGRQLLRLHSPAAPPTIPHLELSGQREAFGAALGFGSLPAASGLGHPQTSGAGGDDSVSIHPDRRERGTPWNTQEVLAGGGGGGLLWLMRAAMLRACLRRSAFPKRRGQGHLCCAVVIP